MKALLVMMLCLGALGAQTPKATPTKPLAQTARPNEANFDTFEHYIEAVVDWKMAQNKQWTPVNVKPVTLAACKKSLQGQLDANGSMSDELAASHVEIELLTKLNGELAAKAGDSEKKFADLL
jgi:hypothetical protein